MESKSDDAESNSDTATSWHETVVNSFDIPVSNRDIVASNSEYAESKSGGAESKFDTATSWHEIVVNSFDVPVSNRDIVASNSEYAENSSDAGDHRRKNAVNSLGSTASNFDRSIDVDRWGSITLDGTAKSVVLRVRNSAQATQRRSATLTRLIDLDSPSPLRKALGDEAFTNLTSGIARCVTSTALYFSLPWDDLSIDKAGSIGEYFVRTRMPVATGKNAEYRAYLKNDVKPVLEKGGVTWYRVSAPTFGGPAGTVETMRRLTNLAEIDGGPIQTKVLGAAGAQALAAKAATLTRGPAQNTILRSRAELSWLPPDMPAR